MIDKTEEVQIDINSPFGPVFRGFSKAVVIKARKQVIIEFRRNWVNYVSLGERAEMTIESGTDCRQFLLKNAVVRLDKQKLSIRRKNQFPAEEMKSLICYRKSKVLTRSA